jgi:hypothetical protein
MAIVSYPLEDIDGYVRSPWGVVTPARSSQHEFR